MADELEESEDMIQRIVNVIEQYGPDGDIEAICKELRVAEDRERSEEKV